MNLAQSLQFCARAANSFVDLPLRKVASPTTDGTHSFRGLPTFRTYWDTRGCKLCALNEQAYSGDVWSARNTLPSIASCCNVNVSDSGCQDALAKTSLFDTLEMNEGAIP